jgi:protein SCO1/2
MEGERPPSVRTPAVSTRPPEGLRRRTPELRIEMDRRHYLAGSAAAATAGLAGCLDSVFGESSGATDDVVLDAPDRYEDLRESRENGNITFPIHADELPEVTVTDALSGRELSTRAYVGERHTLLTFIFARCTMVCPTLTAALAQVQANARDRGYDDELAFMPTTFDPEHDTPEVLESFSEDVGAVPDAEAWHFLRPDGEQGAEEVVTGQMGVWFDFVPESERDMSNMAYSHNSVILLVNADGYVERGYNGSRVPGGAGLLDDVETLRERW